MFQIPYDGGETEHGALIAILRGESIESIQSTFKINGSEIVDICFDYCRCRWDFLRYTNRRRYVWELEIAALQQLSVQVYKEAAAGSLKAIQVYMSMVMNLAELRKRYHRLGREMDESSDTPARPDSEKEQDILERDAARMEELRQKGYTIPERYYRATERPGNLIHAEPRRG